MSDVATSRAARQTQPKPKKESVGLDVLRRRARIFRSIVAFVAVAFALFPVVWIISAALNPAGGLSTQTLIPRGISSVDDLLVNFRTLLTTPQFPFLRWLGNSLIVSSITSVLAVAITALSAYSFSRFRFRGRRSLLVTILLIQVFPNLLAMVALYLLLQQVGNHIPILGLNTLGGLIMVYLGGQMGINIWLMKGFFDSIPRDIDESAQVDGASHWQTFTLLILPLVRPILAVVGILAFVAVYNEFVLARILLIDRDNWTLIIGLFSFVSDNFARDWGIFAAGALIGAIPIVTIYLLLQDQIVGGLTQGAVKG
jgi:arabinogalactan oligomer / maltooligosaccharide transport system permease protein